MKNTISWGNLPVKKKIEKIDFNHRIFQNKKNKLLTYGNGRSYGDVCQNNFLINLESLDKFIEIDQETNTLTCSANLTLKEILKEIIPLGYFLPVVPGTQNVTIGGAIANDIHGKNHHTAGSFGNYVKEMELLRSDIGKIICDNSNHSSLFYSTIGGLGLTGIILSVKIELKKISSKKIRSISKTFKSFEEYVSLNKEIENKFEYCVGWVDLLNIRKKQFRGIILAGNHLEEDNDEISVKNNLEFNFPLVPSFSLVNKLSLYFLNYFYFYTGKRKSEKITNYKGFFFPLDIVNYWNKAYGKKGFFQYQFVVPNENANNFFREFVNELKNCNETPALTVLKSFGPVPSLGTISFPREGVTMAIDFPNKGIGTLNFMRALDDIVIKNNGALYPAKDARMSKNTFIKSFPNHNKFKENIDPKMTSFFWERVK